MSDTDKKELARAHFAAALVAAGTAPALAKRVAEAAEISIVAGSESALIEVSELRAVDTPDSLAALAKELMNGPRTPAEDAAASAEASAEAARKAGREAGQAQKAQHAMTSSLALR